MRNQRFCFLYRHQVSSSKPIDLPAAYRDLNHLRSDRKSPTTKKNNETIEEEEALLSDDESEIQRESTERDRLFLCVVSLSLLVEEEIEMRRRRRRSREGDTIPSLYYRLIPFFFFLTEPYSLFVFFSVKLPLCPCFVFSSVT